MKIIKYLSFIFVIILVLLAGLVATLNFTDFNPYKATLEKQFSELVGREIVIGGDLELSVSLRPRILLQDVRLKNAPWGSQPDMLRIGKAELEVELLPLLLNRIEMRRLLVDDLDVLVESNGEGRSNWALGGLKMKTDKTPNNETGGMQTEIVLYEVLLQNSRVAYKGDADEKAMQFTLDKLGVTHIGGRLQQWSIGVKHNEIPLTIDGTTSYIHDLLAGRPFRSDLKGKLGDVAFDLKGDLTLKNSSNTIGLNLEFSTEAPNLGSISKIAKIELPQVGPVKISGKASDSDGFYLLKLNGAVADLKLDGDGRVSQALDGQGDEFNLVLKAPDLAQLGKLGGTELPKVGPVDVKAKLSAIKDGHKISALDAQVGNSDLKGEISVAYQRKPIFIQADISSKLLDLRQFEKQEAGKKAALKEASKAKPKKTASTTKNDPQTGAEQRADEPAGERVFPDTPLPIDQLKMLNADINYTVAKLESNSQPLSKVKLALKLDNGRLELKPVQAQLESGPIEGDMILDASKQKAKPVVTLNLHSTALELGKFNVLKETMSGGSTKVKVQLKGSGNSVSEIMAGLNGETVLDIGEAVLADGTINLIGGDILGSLLGALAPTEDKAPSASLECAVIRFNVKDGIAKANKGIALKTKKTVMVGSGDINLKTEKISFQISSHSLAAVGVDAGDLTRTVGLGGTLANPKPVIDIEGTAKTGATIGAAILTLGTSYLAQQLIESAIEDDHPCQTALGKESPETGKASAEKATE